MLITETQLPVTENRFPLTESLLSVTEIRVSVTGFQLSIAGSEISITANQLSVLATQLSALRNQLPVTGIRLPVTGIRPPISSDRLPPIRAAHCPARGARNFSQAPPVSSVMRKPGGRQLALWAVLWRPLVCLALLLCQVSVVILTFSPSSSWYLPLMPPRSYRSTPLALVLADLERNGLIPPGTAWATSDLRDRRVTLDLLDLSTHRPVLSRVARAAGVSIEFLRDVHGNIAGPVKVLGEP